jgi:hypothetical protein
MKMEQQYEKALNTFAVPIPVRSKSKAILSEYSNKPLRMNLHEPTLETNKTLYLISNN